MLCLTFGSGFDIENEDPAYLRRIKELADYAHCQGDRAGRVLAAGQPERGPRTRRDRPQDRQARRGGLRQSCRAWAAAGAPDHLRKVHTFIERTGLDLFEHDGSYPGDLCARPGHPGHRGLADSQWTQWKKIIELYRWCRGRGVYLNVPDWYFLNGSSKVFLGYREENLVPAARSAGDPGSAEHF